MSNYWAEREAKHIEEMLKRHVNYEQEIHRRYLKLWETIEVEIQQFYVAYAGKEKISIDEAKRRVSKHDVEIFAEKAKRYVQTRDFSKEANEQLRLYNLTMKVNRLELLKSKIGLYLTDNTNQLQTYFTAMLTEEAVAEFVRQAGILGGSILSKETYRMFAKVSIAC
ncbi:hypothetical protein [Enterococcus faecalis]|uniref:hypothetical protein n=1 Tax=Enterococcus faecalis TaxID=1351 RepID=UPI001F410868|nr:hypothetical protein [Enterococcus faecalis]